MPFSLLKGHAPPIAIDFGVSCLKALQVQPGETPTLLGAAMLPTPDELLDKPIDRLAFQAQSLPQLIRAGHFKGKRAVCSVSSSLAFVQHLQIQLLPGTRTGTLVAEQVRLLTGRDPSSFILRHIDVCEVNRSGSKKQEVIVIAMPRETVIHHMKAIKSAKLEPVGVHTEHMALSRAISHIQRRREDAEAVTMLIDLGYGATKVVICHGQSAVLAKTVLVGGRHLDGAIAKAERCSLSDARRRRSVSLVTQGSPLQSAQRPLTHAASVPSTASGGLALAEDRRTGQQPGGFARVEAVSPPTGSGDSGSISGLIETIGDEVSMCLRYHRALFPDRTIDRVVMVGGGAEDTDLCAGVAESLRLPVDIADPLSSLPRGAGCRANGVDLSRPLPGWAMTFGLGVSPTDL